MQNDNYNMVYLVDTDIRLLFFSIQLSVDQAWLLTLTYLSLYLPTTGTKIKPQQVLVSWLS